MESLHLARPDVLMWLLAVLPATIAFWFFRISHAQKPHATDSEKSDWSTATPRL